LCLLIILRIIILLYMAFVLVLSWWGAFYSPSLHIIVIYSTCGYFVVDCPMLSVEKLWTQNTRIIHDVWRLLILSNEEKGMIMKILKKEWLIGKFWKKGGSRERGRRKRNPCPMRLWIWHIEFHVFKMVNPRSYGLQIEKFIELWTNKK
jgi:hypothetical protein